MNIHHATAKKAEANGVILTVEAGDVIRAHWVEGNRVLIGNDPKQVLADMLVIKMAAIEYPAINIVAVAIGEFQAQIGEEVVAEAKDAQTTLALALEYAEENDIDPEEGAEEADEERRNVVVPERYKEEYKARGNANHCGDWLAITLDGKFIVTTEGGPQFDVDGFRRCLAANGVDMTGKWAGLPESGQRGWQGRYRMNGRQKLEIRVAETGELKLGNTTLKAPLEALDAMWERHPEAALKYAEAHEEAA